jgi:hypothetical protein
MENASHIEDSHQDAVTSTPTMIGAGAVRPSYRELLRLDPRTRTPLRGTYFDQPEERLRERQAKSRREMAAERELARTILEAMGTQPDQTDL